MDVCGLRLAALAVLSLPFVPALAGEQPYSIVDTGQDRCYDARREIRCPSAGKAFSGQDAQYVLNPPRYRDNGDGTVSDLVTGLMWQRDPGEKKTLRVALRDADDFRLAGHDDWRMPTIKELYSLILFSGTDPDPRSRDASKLRPFLDETFVFRYGDERKGERLIDSQYASATKYVSTTMNGDETVFGVNFADGRIKGYPVKDPRRGGGRPFWVVYVRGNPSYGENDFHDNEDGTVTDRATGLTWMQVDSGHLKAGKRKDGSLDWEEALAWAEGLDYAGHDDWRLPDAKELQSLVDYGRSPATTGSAAIDSLFRASEIENEGGKADYPSYWSGTTHANARGGGAGAYVAFGRALGWMSGRDGRPRLLDVHGAGAQRSDPKAGDPDRFPRGRGPQGDVIRIYNHVRCVRGGSSADR